MADSPHQPESLSDKITRLKSELTEWENMRSQILRVGQTSAGQGMSTTYPQLGECQRQINGLRAQIAALTDLLNGDTAHTQPGTNLLSHASDYS